MSLHHRFGGTWTEEKLEQLGKYLAAYMKIFTQNPKAAWYRTIYVDAFAGTGYRTPPEIDRSTARLFSRDEEAILFQKGSAVIALETEPSFDEYLFVDLASDHVRELELLKARYPDKARKVRIEQQEANQFLASWCKSTNWGKTRAVVFLDPYGGQVEWETIQAIAQTNAIDLWVLFPVGAVVNRLLIRNKPPSGAWPASLSLSSITLAPGAAGSFTVSVVVPPSVADGDPDLTTINAVSRAQPSAKATRQLTTTAVVALVDQAKEHRQRLVQMRCRMRARRGQFGQRQLTQAVQGVPPLVSLLPHRQHRQLRGSLRVEKEQDPIEESERLLGQRLGQLSRQRFHVPRGPACHHLVGDDLDGQSHTFAEILRDADGVVDRGFERALPPDVPLCVRRKGHCRQAGQRGVSLATLLIVGSLTYELEVDCEVAPFGPALTLGNQGNPSSKHQREIWRIFVNEQRRQQARQTVWMASDEC